MDMNNNGIFRPVGNSIEEILAKVKATKEQEQREAEQRREAEIAAKAEAERVAREKALKEQQEARAKAEAAFRLRVEAEERARIEAEVKAQIDREQREREAAEQRAFLQKQAELRVAAEKKAREDAERQLQEEMAARARIEKEVRQQVETTYRAQVEAVYRAKVEEATREKERAVAIARAEAERRIIEAAEAKAKAEVVAKARMEAEMRARAEAELRAQVEREIRQKAEEEERQRILQAEKEEEQLRKIAEEQRKLAVDEDARLRLELAQKEVIEQSMNEPTVPEIDTTEVEQAIQSLDDTAVADEENEAPKSFLDSIRSNADIDPIVRRKASYNTSDSSSPSNKGDMYGFRAVQKAFSPGFTIDESLEDELSDDTTDVDTQNQTAESVDSATVDSGFVFPEEPAHQETIDELASSDDAVAPDDISDNTDVADETLDTPAEAVDYSADEESDETEEQPIDIIGEVADDIAEVGDDTEADESAPDEADDAEVDESAPDEADDEQSGDSDVEIDPLANLDEVDGLDESDMPDDPLAAFISEENRASNENPDDNPVFADDAENLPMSTLERLNLNPDLFKADDNDAPIVAFDDGTADELPPDIRKKSLSLKKALRGIPLGGIPLGGKSLRLERSPFMDDISEYVNPDDAEEINAGLAKIKKISVFKAIGTAVAFLLSLVLQLSPVLSFALPNFVNYRANPSGFLWCNIILLVAAIAINGREFYSAARRLVKKSFSFDTTALIVSIAGLIFSLLMFSQTDEISQGASIFTVLPVLSLTILSLFRMFTYCRVCDSFGFMTQNGGENAVCKLDNQSLSAEIGSQFNSAPVVLGSKKMSFADRFFEASFKDSQSDNLNDKLSKLSLIAMGVVFLVSLICRSGFVNSFGTAFVVYALCSPMFFGFALAFQMFISNKTYLSSGASVVGAETTKGFVDSNCMVVRGSDLFNSAGISGLKFMKDNVDEIIKFTAAATLLAKSPLADTFMGMIEGDIKQLPKVDSLMYKDGMGLVCTAEGRTVLIGNRQLMNANSVITPSKDDEGRVLKGNSRMVYVSLDGHLSAMFAVVYTVDDELESQVCDANKCGVNLAVITSDPNITPEFLEETLRLRRSSVCILPSKIIAEYREEMQDDDVVDAGVIHDGSSKGFVSGVAGVRRLFGNLKIIRLMQIISSALWLVVSSAILILGGISSFGLDKVVFILLIALISNTIVPAVRRP